MSSVTTQYADLYEFRWLNIGQQKHVPARDCWQAHKALSRVRQRHSEEMRGRVFRCNNTGDGVMITRLEDR